MSRRPKKPALEAAAPALSIPARLFLIAFPVFGSYLTIWLALNRRLPPVPAARFGDLSYGLYIYGNPIQQALISITGPIDPLLFFLPSLAVTAIPAWISWFYIEKPALRLKEVRLQTA